MAVKSDSSKCLLFILSANGGKDQNMASLFLNHTLIPEAVVALLGVSHVACKAQMIHFKP